MSHFGDLIGVSSPKKEVVDTTPASVEEPVNPKPLNLWDLSKTQLESYGRTVGIELDRRHSKSKLIKELENHLGGQ